MFIIHSFESFEKAKFMRICGIISEYNPFHSGHAHHLKMTRELSQCDYIVCLMSGSFTQRGEPAIFDKWTRAQAAVQSGADLVIELPALFALQSAEGFAKGGIRLLNALNIRDFSFGSEYTNLDVLNKIAHTLIKEPPRYRFKLKSNLNQGMSFPAARADALSNYLIDATVSEIISGSNSILGIEYLKANLSLKRNKLHPIIVKRIGSDYNEPTLSHSFSSATAIRKSILLNGLTNDMHENIPDASYALYRSIIDSDYIPVNMDLFFKEIIYSINKYSVHDITDLPDVSEGLENRIKKVAGSAKSYSELVQLIKSKRYTQTRIQRILCCLLLGINKSHINYANTHLPESVKILAYKKNSNALLSHLSTTAKIKLHHGSAGNDNDLFSQFDIRSTNIHTLAQNADRFRVPGLDFTTKTKTDN